MRLAWNIGKDRDIVVLFLFVRMKWEEISLKFSNGDAKLVVYCDVLEVRGGWEKKSKESIAAAAPFCSSIVSPESHMICQVYMERRSGI